MKKLICITALLMTVTLFSQNNSEWTHVEQSTNFKTHSTEIKVNRLDNGRQQVVETYTTLVDFEAAYAALCNSGNGLVEEAFDNGPTELAACGPVISSAGDDCFSPGEIEEGFTITAAGAGGNQTVFLPVNFVGNTVKLVGANSMKDRTRITFTEPNVSAVGHDIFNSNNGTTFYRIFDLNDNLIETFTLTIPPDTEEFFAFIADEPVGKIEIEEPDLRGELVGNFKFGTCPILGVDENRPFELSVYPNPVGNGTLNIIIPEVIDVQSLVLYDAFGKDTRIEVINGVANLAHLAAGVYFLKVVASEGRIVRKIIRQ